MDSASEPSTPHADELTRLDPAIRLAWVLAGLVRSVILGGLSALADFLWLAKSVEDWPFPMGSLFAVVTVLSLLAAVIMPALRYKHWRWAVREHDVLLRYGVVWRTRRSVPRLRIQHVDIEAGPIARMLGLTDLTFFTAGTGDADATIPGLRPEVAETVRDALLEHDLPELAQRADRRERRRTTKAHPDQQLLPFPEDKL